VRKHAPARTGLYSNVAYSNNKVTIRKQEVTFTGELVKRDWRYLAKVQARRFCRSLQHDPGHEALTQGPVQVPAKEPQ
jgi:hypothetical protein